MIRAFIQRMGQRNPDCIVEKLDPRCKLIIILIVTFMVFLGDPLISVGLFALAVLIAILAKLVNLLLLSTAFSIGLWFVFYLLFDHLLNRPLEDSRSLFYGVVFRGVTLSVTGLAFAVTTKPKDLANALQAWKMPIIIILPLTIAVRFVPTLLNESLIIRDCMRIRRISHKKRYMITKPNLIWQSYLALVIIRSLKMADELAAVAESRAIACSEYSDNFKRLSFGRNDYLAIGLTVACMSIIKFLSIGLV